MTMIDAIGYAGTVFTIIAYAMRSSVHLRAAALLSSVAFMAYGILTEAWPVVMTELVLLPLNAFRLAQLLRDDDPEGEAVSQA